METTFPYPLKWDRGDLDVRIEGNVFTVHFEREYRQPTDPAVSGLGIISTTNLEYERDPLGWAAHTRVEIRFPMYVEEDFENNNRELLRWVHAVINRVLEVYRYTTEEFHVDTIPNNELRDYTVRTLNADGTFDNREPMVTGGITGWLICVPPEPIPDEARRLLRNGTSLPIPKVLYLNAKREELFENYRLAIVETETAFEVLVDQAVVRYYRNQGRSDSDIENIRQAGLKNLIGSHLLKCCGEAFEGTPQHTAWRTNLYDLRNGVVHEGAPVDANQSSQALKAADRAMSWIEARAAV